MFTDTLKNRAYILPEFLKIRAHLFVLVLGDAF